METVKVSDPVLVEELDALLHEMGRLPASDKLPPKVEARVSAMVAKLDPAPVGPNLSARWPACSSDVASTLELLRDVRSTGYIRCKKVSTISAEALQRFSQEARTRMDAWLTSEGEERKLRWLQAPRVLAVLATCCGGFAILLATYQVASGSVLFAISLLISFATAVWSAYLARVAREELEATEARRRASDALKLIESFSTTADDLGLPDPVRQDLIYRTIQILQRVP